LFNHNIDITDYTAFSNRTIGDKQICKEVGGSDRGLILDNISELTLASPRRRKISEWPLSGLRFLSSVPTQYEARLRRSVPVFN